MTITLTEGAKQDVIDITNYTIEKWGYLQATKYIDEIENAYQNLLDDPFTQVSKSRNDLKANLRSFNVGKHAIFYQVKNNTEIKILRILHLSMDFKRHIR